MSSLAQRLTSQDCRVLAALVALTLKRRELPDWRRAWAQLTDLGRRVLLDAPAADLFDCALACWAAQPSSMATRVVRKASVAGLRAQYGAEAAREIERQQISIKGATAQEYAA